MVRFATSLAALTAAFALVPAASAQQTTPARADLADAAAGTYHGDVISDSRGASRSDVTIVITKTGPNTVQIVSDYDRLATVSTRLQRVMDTVQQAGDPTGPLEVFLLNRSSTPVRLDLTIDGASWSGEKVE